MTISGVVWFVVGGLLGCLIGGVTAYNIAFAREYGDKIDYYDLDPIEIFTPSYEEMEEYEGYDFEF